MSGNTDEAAPNSTAKRPDRRVLQTRDALGDALILLMQEQPFDGITVQQVLDRAGVGRSTFYTHYRDKNDLFLSDLEEFLTLASTILTRRKAEARRVAPIRELFAHIADARPVFDAFKASGKVSDFLELGQGIFARSIEERLRLASPASEPAQLRARAHALAGAMFSLLLWWIDQGMKPSAEAMDTLFHELVWGSAPAVPAP